MNDKSKNAFSISCKENRGSIFFVLFLIVLGFFFLRNDKKEPHTSPYPPSPIIKEVVFDWQSHKQLAPGSDLWPVTWGADGHLYASWGDGGGFGGTNKDGRVSLGFARIKGVPQNFLTENLWGGKDTKSQAQFRGKSAGMISINGILYAWINMQNKTPPDEQLIWSEDLGLTWQKANWSFDGEGPFFAVAFLNFGKDYADAKDQYVYSYGYDRSDRKHLYLCRVFKNRIKDRAAYEFFAGLQDGEPVWSREIKARKPVASDPGRMQAVAAVYNKTIDRYLLTSHFGASVGEFAIFDAPEPWGPWTTVGYYNDWGDLGSVRSGMPHSFPAKWISSDGLTMYMIFSGTGIYDSFNLIKVTLKLKEPATLIPESKL